MKRSMDMECVNNGGPIGKMAMEDTPIQSDDGVKIRRRKHHAHSRWARISPTVSRYVFLASFVAVWFHVFDEPSMSSQNLSRNIFVAASDNYYYTADDDNGDDDVVDDVFDDVYFNDNVDDGNTTVDNPDERIYFSSPNGYAIPYNELAVMPVQCLNINNGHLLKFELFQNNEQGNRQCRTLSQGSYIISVAHFMHAYFNYEALTKGKNFNVPKDAGYLNCVMLKSTIYAKQPLYAKIGCAVREARTSTKLQLHVYKDNSCIKPYDDGVNLARGYFFNDKWYSKKISFTPPFYRCTSCAPEEIDNSFSKAYSAWYDDDVINSGGGNNYASNSGNGGGGQAEHEDEIDDAYDADDAAYYTANNEDVEDLYAYWTNPTASPTKNPTSSPTSSPTASPTVSAYQDDYGGGDDYQAAGDDNAYQKQYTYGDDDFYAYSGDDDDGGRMRFLDAVFPSKVEEFVAADGELEKFEGDFWKGVAELKRELAQSDDEYGIGEWNMCQRFTYKGLKCNSECQAITHFASNRWTNSDIILLVSICSFMCLMMLLIFAKRVKAYERAIIYGLEYDGNFPGLPPICMVLLFAAILVVIVVLANLRYVNETLIFAVVVSVLAFIYMLKLTLFDSEKRSINPAVAYDTMSRQLFDSGV